VDLERLERVLVVGGDEHDVGSRVDQLQDLETVELRHLDVQEHHVRHQLTDPLDRLEPVSTLADHHHPGLRGQVLAHQVAGRALVVDDHGAQRRRVSGHRVPPLLRSPAA
jgi:hypothetical protein